MGFSDVSVHSDVTGTRGVFRSVAKMLKEEGPGGWDAICHLVKFNFRKLHEKVLYKGTPYIKYNERMSNLISPAHALAVCGVQMMKFIRSVTWGSEIPIATFLCPPAHGSDDTRAEAAGEEQLRLIHAWYDTDEVGARPTGDSPKQTPLTPHNISICSYKMPTSAAAREAVVGRFCTPPKSHPLFRLRRPGLRCRSRRLISSRNTVCQMRSRASSTS